VGGVYRDQGQQAVSRWLNPLLKSRVEIAYQDLHKFYHPTPESISLLQPSTPPSRYSSPGVSSAFPNHPAEIPVATRHESTGDRSNRRRRRPSSSREGGIRNGGRQGMCSSMRSYRTDLIFDAALQTVLDAQRVDGRDAAGRRVRTRTKAQGSGLGQVGRTLYDFILCPPNPVCLLSMLLAAEGRKHRERTQRGNTRRKEAQQDEGGDLMCMIPFTIYAN
jgi:hypothetical protein